MNSLNSCLHMLYSKCWRHYWNTFQCFTLNRKSLSCFVRTKPSGSVVITKPLALRMSLCAVFLCKYTKVLWLCKSKGFHNSFLRVFCLCPPSWKMTWMYSLVLTTLQTNDIDRVNRVRSHTDGALRKSGAKTAPFWSGFGKRCHFGGGAVFSLTLEPFSWVRLDPEHLNMLYGSTLCSSTVFRPSLKMVPK